MYTSFQVWEILIANYSKVDSIPGHSAEPMQILSNKIQLDVARYGKITKQMRKWSSLAIVKLDP